jgi:hypothetical protein
MDCGWSAAGGRGFDFRGFLSSKNIKQRRADEGGLLLLTLKTTPLKTFTFLKPTPHAG